MTYEKWMVSEDSMPYIFVIISGNVDLQHSLAKWEMAEQPIMDKCVWYTIVIVGLILSDAILHHFQSKSYLILPFVPYQPCTIIIKVKKYNINCTSKQWGM